MIYLDYNATTPVDERVLEAMLPYFSQKFGNPSSSNHAFGREAYVAIEEAREKVAALIGASPREIFFTSGATESCSMAIKGALWAAQKPQAHVITTSYEHKAVLNAVKRVGMMGYFTSFISPEIDGTVRHAALIEALSNATFLVSICAANNVLGTVNAILPMAETCAERGILFHTDATQAIGKMPFDVRTIPVDLVSFSGHKIYAPKGIGVLFVRERKKRIKLIPLIEGGGQERGLRAGTENVPSIVALGHACDIISQNLVQESTHICKIRDLFEKMLIEANIGAVVNGNRAFRLPNTSNISFANMPAQKLLDLCGNIAASAGSACTSGGDDPNYALKACGYTEETAMRAIRFSFGRFSTIQHAIDASNALVATCTEKLK